MKEWRGDFEGCKRRNGRANWMALWKRKRPTQCGRRRRESSQSRKQIIDGRGTHGADGGGLSEAGGLAGTWKGVAERSCGELCGGGELTFVLDSCAKVWERRVNLTFAVQGVSGEADQTVSGSWRANGRGSKERRGQRDAHREVFETNRRSTARRVR